MTKLRKWLWLIAVLYLAPAAVGFGPAAAHPGMQAADDPAAGAPVALMSVPADACEHCADSGEEPCTDVDCCFLCSAGVVVVRVNGVAPVVVRDAVVFPDHRPLAHAVFPPPFRPPIG